MAKFGFQAAQEEASKQQKGNNKPEEYNKFTLTAENSPLTVRFVVEDGENSVLTFSEHWVTFQNGWTRNYLCINEEPGDEKCLICKLAAEDRASKGAKLNFQKHQRSVKHMINLIDRTDEVLKAWKFSPLAMGPIMPHYTEFGTVGDRDYTLALTKNEDPAIKLKYVYTVEPASTKKVALSAADKKLIETRYNLETLMPKYDEEDILRLKDRPADGSSAPTVDKAEALLENMFANKKTTSVDDLASKVAPSTSSVAVAEEESEPAGEDNEDFFSLLKTMNEK